MSSDPYFWLIIIVVLTVNLVRRRQKIIAMSQELRTIATPEVNRPKEGDHDANRKCP